MKRILFLIACCIIFKVTGNFCYSQQNPEKNYWLGVAAGVGASRIIVDVSANYNYQWQLFSAQMRLYQPNAVELGILYGVMLKRNGISLSASAGLGYTNIDFSSRLCLPANVQFYVTDSASISYGVGGFVNIRPEKTFGGILFGIRFGSLK